MTGPGVVPGSVLIAIVNEHLSMSQVQTQDDTAATPPQGQLVTTHLTQVLYFFLAVSFHYLPHPLVSLRKVRKSKSV